jgi:Fe-S oxidoreductase
LKKRTFGTYQQRNFDKVNKPKIEKFESSVTLSPECIMHLRNFFKEFFDFGLSNIVEYIGSSVFEIKNSNGEQEGKDEENEEAFVKFLTFALKSLLIMK